MSSQTLTKALEKAIRQMFRPLVRILLRNGVSFGHFAEIAKRVYVEVATDEFRIPGRAQTTSRVATLTGLTRKEVQRLNKAGHEEEEANGNSRYNRAARVISAWTSQPQYLDETGQPARLVFDGHNPSFTSLVKSASGDIPPRTILDELIHVGAVKKVEEERLQLLTRAYIPFGDDAEKIAILGSDVAALIQTIDHNLNCPRDEAYFQRKVCYDNLPVEAMEALRQTIARQAQAALEEMNEEMARCDRDANPEVEGSGQVRAGLGIYYFEENGGRAPHE